MKTRTTILWRTENQLKINETKSWFTGEKKKSTKLIGLQLTDQETKKKEDSNYQNQE